jgi:hypothetical protein
MASSVTLDAASIQAVGVAVTNANAPVIDQLRATNAAQQKLIEQQQKLLDMMLQQRQQPQQQFAPLPAPPIVVARASKPVPLELRRTPVKVLRYVRLHPEAPEAPAHLYEKKNNRSLNSILKKHDINTDLSNKTTVRSVCQRSCFDPPI